MDHFNLRDGQLHAENVAVAGIADQYGTPCYVYSRATLERHWRAFDQALAGHTHLVCYAVKANSNLAVLNLLARLGSGFDIVSVGELERVLAAGGSPGKIVFSGVGKRGDEIERGLEAGIRCFNVESTAELERIESIARTHNVQAPVSLRVNPDVDAGTHPYISTGLKENKFGIAVEAAYAAYRQAHASPYLKIQGIDCHIGSQLTSVTPFVNALERILQLRDRLADSGIRIAHLDLGGGLGIQYRDEAPPSPEDYVAALLSRLDDRDCEILIEPGRAIVGNAGILVTRVEYLKKTETRQFAIVDAAMNDLLRPSLYSAWQEVVAVEPRSELDVTYDIVGPVCETGDFLARNRSLSLAPGDLLAVRSAGAYGFTMASNYNSRPRAAEILVDGYQTWLIREREALADLWRGEHLLPETPAQSSGQN